MNNFAQSFNKLAFTDIDEEDDVDDINLLSHSVLDEQIEQKGSQEENSEASN